MGTQSASRLDGDSYQHLYSWYEILRLLAEPSVFDTAYVEHPAVEGAGDDVTLHPRPGSGAAARYYQIKYHVDQREAYGFETFLKAKKRGTCLLEKLFKTWKSLRDDGPCEVWLISNWAADTNFGAFIDQTYQIKRDFLLLEGRAKHADAKKQWQTKLGSELDEFHEFMASLRLRLGFANFRDLEETCSHLMRAEGLKYDTPAIDTGIAIVRRWIAERGTKGPITKARLLAAIQEYHLKIDEPDAPNAGLVIHAWDKQTYDATATVELDWTPLFDHETRRIPSPAEWEALQKEVRAARTKIEGIDRYVDFRGRVPLSCGLMVGSVFRAAAGFALRTEQTTGSVSTRWSSKAPPSDVKFDVRYEAGGNGEDTLVVLAISGSAIADAKRFFTSGYQSTQFTKLVYAEPYSGVGQQVITGSPDAVALASTGKELIQRIRQETEAHRIHLVLYAPLAFAIFLGQQLNALGEIVSYERILDSSYAPVLTLRTG